MDAQPTLVVLPGLDGTGLLTTPLLDALTARGVPAQVLRYPQEGPQDYATLAARVRLQLPETPFVLLGESFAGPLAVLLAAQTPPALRGVVLSHDHYDHLDRAVHDLRAPPGARAGGVCQPAHAGVATAAACGAGAAVAGPLVHRRNPAGIGKRLE